jgi:anti-sigma regulatory factor (Ser/Thr protein kinase)
LRDLSLHILDIVQNSITAKAKHISINIGEQPDSDQLVLEIEDDGVGMDSETLSRVTDPFVTSRTTRKVGLGIPLLMESAKRCEGQFKISSQKNIGTKVYASFIIKHIDRIPIGSIADTVTLLISAHTEICFILNLSSSKGSFSLDTDEIVKTLKGVPINEYAVLQWLKEYIDEGIKNIFGGVLDEVDS